MINFKSVVRLFLLFLSYFCFSEDLNACGRIFEALNRIATRIAKLTNGCSTKVQASLYVRYHLVGKKGRGLGCSELFCPNVFSPVRVVQFKRGGYRWGDYRRCKLVQQPNLCIANTKLLGAVYNNK